MHERIRALWDRFGFSAAAGVPKPLSLPEGSGPAPEAIRAAIRAATRAYEAPLLPPCRSRSVHCGDSDLAPAEMGAAPNSSIAAAQHVSAHTMGRSLSLPALVSTGAAGGQAGRVARREVGGHPGRRDTNDRVLEGSDSAAEDDTRPLSPLVTMRFLHARLRVLQAKVRSLVEGEMKMRGDGAIELGTLVQGLYTIALEASPTMPLPEAVIEGLCRVGLALACQSNEEDGEIGSTSSQAAGAGWEDGREDGRAAERDWRAASAQTRVDGRRFLRAFWSQGPALQHSAQQPAHQHHGQQRNRPGYASNPADGPPGANAGAAASRGRSGGRGVRGGARDLSASKTSANLLRSVVEVEGEAGGDSISSRSRRKWKSKWKSPCVVVRACAVEEWPGLSSAHGGTEVVDKLRAALAGKHAKVLDLCKEWDKECALTPPPPPLLPGHTFKTLQTPSAVPRSPTARVLPAIYPCSLSAASLTTPPTCAPCTYTFDRWQRGHVCHRALTCSASTAGHVACSAHMQCTCSAQEDARHVAHPRKTASLTVS